MGNALKKLDKKFLIIVCSIFLIPILLIIFLAIIQGCNNRKLTYESYEKKMISAAEKYITSKNKIPTEEAETFNIKLSKLVEIGYLKPTKKALKDDSCQGEVTVRRNGSSIETNDGGFLNYTVNLKCNNYSTTHLVDKLLEDVVTSESGLYATESGYVFKGNKLNNYISFYGHDYRIVSIDNDGIIKLVKSEPESSSRVWDNKYNKDVNRASGKSIYKDSTILSYLISDYQNSKIINKKAKQHIVAYDVCVGKRSASNYSISKNIDCSSVLEKQVISLLNVSDYALASIDSDCDSTNSKSCRNYNYMSNVASSTWTLNSVVENSYDVFMLINGLQDYQDASYYNEYNIVIYIDGNELYTSGSGSLTNPYLYK